MGQKVTIAMTGRLQLSIDGSPQTRPLDVQLGGIELDLDYLMQNDHLKFDAEKPGKVAIKLENVGMTLLLDADEILSRGAAAIVVGLEKEISE